MIKNKTEGRTAFRGAALVVDLGARSARVVAVPERWGRLYLGGPGLAARLLFEPGNQRDCVIAPGLLLGLSAHTAAKGSICALSPLTGQWGESNLGGSWPVEVKNAGFDLVQIKGAASDWVTVRIDDDEVSFEPARDLLGLSPAAVEAALRERWGKRFRVAAIGVAGENQARIAGIGADLRWAGRCGLGADWGARRVKAVAVAGSKKSLPADPERFAKAVRDALPPIRERCQSLNLYGTAGSTVYRENLGALPVKNFQLGNFPGAKFISGQAMVEKYEGKKRACPHCPIACGKLIKAPNVNYEGPMPEYEAVASLGSLLLIDDPETVILANQACNDLGLDVISAGVAAAFAVEAYEKGFLRREDFENEPAWGSRAYLLEVLSKMARREGIGDLLADGVRAAAGKLGGNAEEFAVHAQGLEVPMQDPRAFVSLALTYAVSPRGAAHTESMSFYTEQGFELSDLGYPDGTRLHEAKGKGAMTAVMQSIANVYDNLGLCKFMLVAGIGPTTLQKWIEHGAGFELTPREVMEAGARSITAKRFFNLERVGRKPGWHLAHRMLHEPRGTGGSAHSLPDMETMVRDYYAAMGWSEDGVPPAGMRPGEDGE